MMIAYDETYLPGAQRRLGAFLDFATYGLGASLGCAYSAFLASPLSRRFATGDPAIVAGRSGEELALEALAEVLEPPVANRSAREWTPGEAASPEFWTGWALAFYQWASGYSFHAIEERVHIEDIMSLYAPFHEMDVRQVCDRLDALCSQAHPQTNLQARRLAAGLSQSQLARAAGIPVRTLQQYEQRQKNINHARADYVVALARVLGCTTADLFEHAAQPSCEYSLVSL